MFKGASRHMQRMAAKTNKKADQARKLSKLDQIAKGKSSKALRGKLKNIEGQAARRAKRKVVRAEREALASDPVAIEERARRVAAKLAHRMRNVVVEVKKKSR
ncbi:hypothetical protein [Bradyrhizobium iriomotense]|uniref:hypothetical protein n=1 Tax=Bradyrhizobium iriomotense TaxID=441950 RepID=UPI001B8A6678|nr:hypothetical protein [Bradyrhizobium iriomotense]MBR1128426.1 hypothetical protein [Bradyrhizobium iriomotense]